MATDREKEREAELESAMYTNCLLLGLDPTVLGVVNGSPSVGQFRHTNPKLGEQILYFLLSSLRGPIQSAKDFDKVWPIFDNGQSREFRKIVQAIITELEMQGALPRSSSRLSSLATCCGPRFVELLWQLSVHTLREVYKRMFPSDAVSDPLPSALTDFSYSNAAALIPITKARIALERRKFIENASVAVHRQNTWSNLSNEMTAEFRSLCAEEAYLQQELEKLQDMRNKAKSGTESWDDRASSSSGQTSHLVSKASHLWESLLARKSQHEVLASGPIEDVIAHREHRYRISGTSLLTAMQLNSQERNESPELKGKYQTEDRPGVMHQTVDVAEIMRRWTHALQRIHRQSLYLAKANGGEGPDLLRSALEGETSGHAESLSSTLAEHRQHLVSYQGLINQLKEVIPTIQNSISELTEEVNTLSASEENGSEEVADVASKFSSMQIEKPPSPAPKLPHLFSLSPNPKNSQAPKRNAKDTQMHPQETVSQSQTTLSKQPSLTLFEKKQPISQESDGYNAEDIRRTVREAALSKKITKKSEKILEKTNSISDEASVSEHYFMPVSSKERPVDNFTSPNLREQKLVFGSPKIRPQKVTVPVSMVPDNKVHAASFVDDSFDEVFSPPLLMESSMFPDIYEDLLAPLSETDAALMDL